MMRYVAILRAVRTTVRWAQALGAEIELRDVVLILGLTCLFVGVRDALSESVAYIVLGVILIVLAVFPAASTPGKERLHDGSAPAPARRSDTRGRSTRPE